MSIRQSNPGGIVKPGFNPLAAQTTTYLYNLYSWGENSTYGQLGLSNLTSYSSPKQVGALYWTSVSSIFEHTLAIGSDGTLWNWGTATGLGSGTFAPRSSPSQVGSLTTWSKIAAGRAISFAIKTDGTMWVWGSGTGYFGENGLGNLTAYSSPKQVGALTNWLNVACGNYHIAAVKTNGTLWTWGGSNYGELGDGVGTNRSSPVQIGALTAWSSVSCGHFNVYAIKTDGTIWSWGINSAGHLGLGDTTARQSPVQIGALTNWSSVVASGGGQSAYAVKTDGTLWTWGSNGSGRLGLGDNTNRSSPVQVGLLTTWSSTFGGQFHGGAIKTDGTLWSWGYNNIGQLGLGNTTNYSSPKQVGSLTTWLKATAGYTHTIALG